MLSSSLLSVMLLAMTEAKSYTVMAPKPIARGNYTPNNQFKAAYQSLVPNSPNHILEAHMAINANFPSLNLDNFLEITGVDCKTQNQVTVTFDSDLSAQHAESEWTSVKDMALFLGHHHACAGVSEAQAKSVSSITINNNVLSLSTADLDMSSLIGDYELNIKQAPSPHINKRGLIHQNADLSHNFQLDMNFNETSQSAEDDIAFRTEFGKIECIDCYAHGNSTIELKIKATFFVVKSYDLSISGEVWANMDLDLIVPKARNDFVFNQEVARLPLSPISVPGVFNFGPELLLKAGVSYSVTDKINFKTGFDMHVPFNFDISSSGLFSVPTITHTGTPVINEHPFQHTNNIQVGVGAHLTPAISLDISIFAVKAVDMTLALDNSLGVEFNMGKFTECPADKWDLTLYHEHDFTFDIKVLKFRHHTNIYDTGKLPIDCLFCSKCKASPSTISALPSATSTVDISVSSTYSSLSAYSTDSATISVATSSADSPAATSIAITSYATSSSSSCTTSTTTQAPLAATIVPTSSVYTIAPAAATQTATLVPIYIAVTSKAATSTVVPSPLATTSTAVPAAASVSPVSYTASSTYAAASPLSTVAVYSSATSSFSVIPLFVLSLICLF